MPRTSMSYQLNVHRKATLMAYLLSHSVGSFFEGTEGMPMLIVLPFLPNALFRPLSELPQIVLELLVLFLFLLGSPPLILGVKCFRRTPLLPSELFDLVPQEEHHVSEGRFVGVRFEKMGH